MKHRRVLSTLLSLAILLSCVGWTPSRAEETTPEVQTEQSQAAEQTESAVYTEQMSREELPEIVAQEAPVNHGHVGRLENEEQDNLNQFIFLNQDGSKTMYLYDHPVKYRDEAGNIHDISLNIADTDDTAYPFRTEANWAVTAFPRELANGITLESEGAQIKMIPILPNDSTTVLNHMARRVDEDTVAYTYDSATQLEYQLTYDGFKEEIVVSEYTGQTEYHFFLYTNGLALTQLEGGYYLTDEAGNIQGTIGDIIVFTADERNNTLGQLQAVTVKENGIYLLTIVLEADYLADPNTQYPIRIDPTVSLTYAESGADAIEDVVLQSGRDSLPEYGGTVIGKSSKGISRLLMRFPGIDFSSLAGVTVTYAAVSLRDLMCEEAEMPITCYPFTGSAWTESTADWSVTQQSWGAAISSHTISYYDGLEQTRQFWYDFDITSLAQQWVDGTMDEDKGIILRSTDAVENSEILLYKTFASYERASYKAYFTLIYQGSITVNPGEVSVDVGDSVQLTATTIPAGESVSWESSNNMIATVDSTGVVTGICEGEAIITARTDADTFATCAVTVTAPAQITLNQTSVDVVVGDKISLEAEADPQNQVVTWSSSDSSIATVSTDGTVTGVHAGVATITAQMESGASASCTVRVILPEGVYYIQNLWSRLYLNVEDGGIFNNTDVCQQNKHGDGAGDLEKVCQMWKICHLGNGNYSVRPLHKMDMGLHVSSINVDIYNIGDVDTSAEINNAAEWTIEWYRTGYLFKNKGQQTVLTTFTMQTNDGSMEAGETIISFTDTAPYQYSRWSLERISSPPIGVIMYDTVSGLPVQTIHKYIAPEEFSYLENMGVEIETYPVVYQYGMFDFSASNENVDVHTITGALTGVIPGHSTLYGEGMVDGRTLRISLEVTITDVPNGVYVIQTDMNKWQMSLELTSETMNDGLRIRHAEFSMEQEQQWEITHDGDGYYTIRSICGETGGYLGYEMNEANNDEILSRANDQYSDTRWKIDRNEDGKYEISPKDNQGYMMQAVHAGSGALCVELDENATQYRWILVNTEHILDAEYIAQETDAWCWIASAKMFLMHHIPLPHFGDSEDQTQLACAMYFYDPTSTKYSSIYDMGGSPKAAVDYYLGTTDYPLNVTYVQKQIFSKETLMQFIDEGHVLIINRQWYDAKDNGYEWDENNPGHMYVLTGYVWIEGTVWFVLLDPGPGAESGAAKLMTYEKLCCGYDKSDDEVGDTGFWWGSVVVDPEFDYETLPWLGPENYEVVNDEQD